MSTADTPPTIEGLTFIGLLGSGGYADVFLYGQETPRRNVAVKVLREKGLSAATITRFTNEANVMARLEHPYIVPVYMTGTTLDHRPFLAMMYYPRPSLAERARAERFSVAETLQLGIQLGAAVETAHRAGLLHRDIKPANVLTSAYGRPGLADFGIAGKMTSAEDDDAGVSVPWSPPETLYATVPASARSDVYSLAATLWHLLVGRSPFEIPGGDNSPFTLMRRIRDIEPPGTGRADAPASLDRLLRAAMAKDPAVRPTSALEFVRALQAIEQELRLPRTPLELADDAVPHMAAPLTGPDRTQVRSPQRISAQTPASPLTGSGITPGDAVGTRRSTPRVAPVNPFDAQVHGQTVLRPVGVEPVEEAPAVSAPGKRWLLWALAVLVLGVVIAVAFAVATLPAPVRAPVSAPVVEAPPEVGQVVPPPGIPQVDCRRKASKVTCSWTYSNPMPNDRFEWRIPGSEDRTPVNQPRVTLNGTTSSCIEVKVFRNDGSYVPADWTKGCVE